MTRCAPADAGDPAPLPAVPGYEVLGELACGAMGVVYKARQISLNRVVALKMILTGARSGPVARARFRAEAEAVALLQHPNIVQVHQVGECPGGAGPTCPFLVLEYCAGGSLAALLEVGGASALRGVTSVANEWADGRQTQGRAALFDCMDLAGGLPVGAGFDCSGVPIGTQLASPPFAEARLLRIAAALEAAAALTVRRPPL